MLKTCLSHERERVNDSIENSTQNDSYTLSFKTEIKVFPFVTQTSLKQAVYVLVSVKVVTASDILVFS